MKKIFPSDSLAALRKYPGLYRALRSIRRGLSKVWFELWRGIFSRKSLWGPPKGWYSEFDLVRSGNIDGRIILTGQKRPQLPPDSLRTICGFKQDTFQPWPVFWSHRRAVRLVGRSLALLDDNKQLCLEAAYGTHCLTREESYNYIKLPAAIHLQGNWTSLISQWSYPNSYYHWFTDVLPRLAVISQFPADTQILVHADLLPYQRATLEYLGLAGRLRPTTEKHLMLENYYFSSPTAMTGCWNPYATEYLRRTFLSWADLNLEGPKRFYLRRTGRVRGIKNEAEVVSFFQEMGWAIVDAESLTVPQQIQLFARAECVCTLHGAGLTNLLWCRPGCKVLELCPQTFLNGCYEGLAEDLKLDYHYLICPADNMFVATVDLAQLQQAVGNLLL